MMGGWNMMGWGWGYGGRASWLQFVLGLLLLGAVGWFFLAALHQHASGHDAALESLRMRLARGEITLDEFDTLRTALTK